MNAHFVILIEAFVLDLQQRNIRWAFTGRRAFTGRKSLILLRSYNYDTSSYNDSNKEDMQCKQLDFIH